ncbi:hypothetical protein RMCBS344292_00483 [Rhizopus microsporus]|nr:hypothetical protein RMCBS344292_00483 [Rhizopus microsporus]
MISCTNHGCLRKIFDCRSLRFYSSLKDNKKNITENTNHKKPARKPVPDVISFMPVVNIPMTELAFNAFYSLHRPLLGLSIPRPFMAGNMVGQITKEEDNPEEALMNYMATLKPFHPPPSPQHDASIENKSTTTLTVEIDPSYFFNHNIYHEEMTDYLTAIQKELDILHHRESTTRRIPKRKRLRKRSTFREFFEKN